MFIFSIDVFNVVQKSRPTEASYIRTYATTFELMTDDASLSLAPLRHSLSPHLRSLFDVVSVVAVVDVVVVVVICHRCFQCCCRYSRS